MITTAELVASLQRRLAGLGFDCRQIEQVDFVDCETGDEIMAYFYGPGDECAPLSFLPPPFFDEIEAASALLRGDAVIATLH